MKTEIEFVPYGEALTARFRKITHHRLNWKPLERTTPSHPRVFVAFSYNLDERFVEAFRQKATEQTRLLILNEGESTDRLLTRILDLQIRTPQRCYVIEGKFGSGGALTLNYDALLQRLVAVFTSEDKENRILDAQTDREILRIVSPSFDRLEVPLSAIPAFKHADRSQIEDFEIDDDGAFIYWPQLDVHLGWIQLQQLVDRKAALKASQKSEEFNKRYGKAVQKVREKAGLKRADISGISEKQLGRIEKGECRVTSNAIEALAKAHSLTPNTYMAKVAEAMI